MRRFAASAAWMRARAVNAVRRSGLMIGFGLTLAAAILVALLLVPRTATRAASAVVERIPDRPDTTQPLRVRQQAFATITRADSLLALARREAAAAQLQPVDTTPPHLRYRRDSLVALIAQLNSLIARAENAPLASSYRAIAESPLVASQPGVADLMQSLTEIERERESFGAVSGVDPVYVALTARANAVGRSLVAIARQRRDGLRAELAPLLPPRPPPRPVVAVDTLRVASERADASRLLLGANEELGRMRERNREIDALERRARELREVGAPLGATIAAALVIGLALGFGAALFAEMRSPRIADVREAETTAGVRALAVVQPRVEVPERARRSTDEAIPEIVDPVGEHYRLAYLHLTGRDEPLTRITITGDEPAVAAVVAINIAAYDVREARSALVVDTDPLTSGVARALGIPAEPGLSAVLADESSWGDATVYVPGGRDQVLAVMPSGRRSGRPSPDAAARVREALERMSARHDLIVFVSSPEQAAERGSSILLSRDVVVCARLSHTTIASLSRIASQLRAAGMTIHGLMIWNADPVRLKPLKKSKALAERRPQPVPV